MDATPNRTLSLRAHRFLFKQLSACFLRLSALLVLFVIVAMPADAANFRTRNFLVDAPNPELAKAVGDAAEHFRDELAVYWTGSTLPPWPRPCPIRVIAGSNLAAQGVTTYNPAPVRDFQMEVIGTPERILDSVLPHEVTHTVLATYFGRPLPRWADEGICTTVEHASERAKHEAKLREFLSTRRGIAMNDLFRLTEYPADVLPMYAQGYSVCRFLIEQGGPTTFIQFLKDYMQRPSWTANVQKHYQYDSLAELQQYWLAWVEAGSGPVAQYAKVDRREATAATAPANSSSASRGGVAQVSAIAPASALAASDMSARQHEKGLNQDLVAANDRGRIAESSGKSGWYHRRATGTDMISDSSPKRVEPIPPGERIADLPPAQHQRSSTVPAWAPPSVLSSGRYSAATPQGETMRSMRRYDGALDSRNRNAEMLGPNGGIWR
jgi:hypothetical protein